MKKIRFLFIIWIFTIGFMLCSCQNRDDEIIIEQPGKEEQEEETEKKENEEGKESEGTSETDSDDGEAASGEAQARKEEEKKSVWVDVSGAVNAPGVYELEEGSRVFQAIEAAGGFAGEADTQWLNQALPLTDGAKIQVYTKEETSQMDKTSLESMYDGEINRQEESKSQTQSSDKVNLNTADLAKLQEIPGIGEVRARAILDYREEAGSFQNIEEIQEVPGIKGKTFEKIEDYITVE